MAAPAITAALVDALLADDDALDRLAGVLAPRLASTSAGVSRVWFTVDEAAERLRCSRQRIYDLVHDGRLEPARDGRRLLFHQEALDEYLLSSA